ncbi:DUF4174 domain-containing protein [Imperialibacter roseus]|uniref:DUF4174 domain-containing protein n=1 Tax=Imperialibacter roseus TaxID=1324217 RepID=A0ABZ0IM02_9BACT|nr:DUF4174 domain-containing protein [Imperialibacter roseus]WOK04791.1 DUF4174 domain-containing protein [Imperialibacter roseus]
MISIAFVLMSMVGLGGEKSGDPLVPFAWKNRIILFFHSESNAGIGVEQVALFKKQQKEFDDRDLVLGVIEGGRNGAIGGASIGAKDAATLQQTFNPTHSHFLIVLIGKDGGVKLKEQTVVSVETIFDLVDSMPMRRAEMRRNQ